MGLILPSMTGILTWLTPTAAACVVALMIIATIYHARRPGEGRNMGTNLFLTVLAAIVVFGRIFVAPF